MAVKRELIGLNTYLYTFGLKEKTKFNQYMNRLKRTGKVTEVFLNNKYAFEYKRFRR